MSDRDRAGLRDLQARLETFRWRYGVPAVGAATVTSDGVEGVGVSGVRARGRSTPVARDDCWHLGSCTKAATAVLYVRLVERGAARWDAPVPDLFGDSSRVTNPGWESVTIEQVLTHRSGLPDNLSPAAQAAAYVDERPLVEQRAAVATAALAVPPRGVGSFLYSNLGYIVVAAAVERVTGQSWEDSVTAEVLRPLGISSVGFGAPVGDHPWGHRARWPRQRSGRGAPIDPGDVGRRDLRADNPPVMAPAGGLHLTLDDWGRFIAVFLADGGSLLQAGTITRITAAAPGLGPHQGMR